MPPKMEGIMSCLISGFAVTCRIAMRSLAVPIAVLVASPQPAHGQPSPARSVIVQFQDGPQQRSDPASQPASQPAATQPAPLPNEPTAARASVEPALPMMGINLE